MSINWP
jgi:hypothetical protein